MAKAKKYFLPVLAFVLDIMNLGYRVMSQLELPSRRKRGNILSSLFTFTVGLLERLFRFEKEILDRPLLFRNRYIRAGLQVAFAVFIFVSSFEWTGERTATPIVAGSWSLCSPEAAKPATERISGRYPGASCFKPKGEAPLFTTGIEPPSRIVPCPAALSATCIYLRNRNLLV